MKLSLEIGQICMYVFEPVDSDIIGVVGRELWWFNQTARPAAICRQSPLSAFCFFRSRQVSGATYLESVLGMIIAPALVMNIIIAIR